MTAPAGTVYYQYTKPMVGERRSVALPITHQIGYHTHPNGSFNFSNKFDIFNGGSGSDAEWIKAADSHLYVGAMADNDVAGAVKIGICEYESACMKGVLQFGNPPTRTIQ